jgi:HTH-type transcriptional regulator/antitoxin HigA
MTATVLEKDTLIGFEAPRVITSDAQLERYIAVLLELERRDRLTRKEKEYAELLTILIDNYEAKKYSVPSASPMKVLAELMSANDLRQKDLVGVFGAESIVSEILHGKRTLNRHHIEKLSAKFGVSPAVFF